MLREKLTRNRVGEEEGIAWRGVELSRIEGLSDAVFAFAITLLVVSLEVPETFDELLATVRGFFAFAICFALLFAVWNEHHKFSRRYGLWDASTVGLNAALLFIVLLYVYPLKFLFTILVDELLGFSTEVRLPNGDVVGAIGPGQVPLLMVIYGAGFISIRVLFVLLYLRAYALRGTLELDASEILITRQVIQGFLLMTTVGLVSVAVAVFGGRDAASWAGLAYLLLFPLQAANGYLVRSRRRNNATAEGTDDR